MATKRKRTTKKSEVVESIKTYAFKVVRATNKAEIFKSASIHDTRLEKEYQIGKKTEAPKDLFEAGFGLCIFQDIIAAKQFADYRPVFKVEVGEIIRPHQGRPSIKSLPSIAPKEKTKTSYKSLLRQIEKKSDQRSEWPNGTVMCDWLVLIERIN
jgi:hypothetical protein